MGKSIAIDDIDQWVLEYNVEKITSLLDAGYDDVELDVIKLAHNIVTGNLWQSIQTSPFITALFNYDKLEKDDTTAEDYFFNLNQAIEDLDESSENQLALLLTGITFLNVYIQINWTGPGPKEVPQFNNTQRYKEIKSLLEVDGEPIYTKVVHPEFLYLARLCLVDNYAKLDSCRSSCWWSCRAMMYHQRSLPNPTPSLKSAMAERFQIVNRFFVDVDPETDRAIDLAASAAIESSLTYLLFKQKAKVAETLEQATKVSGLIATLTGALGRRTRFQTFDTAQLVLDVTKSRASDAPATKANIDSDSMDTEADPEPEQDMDHEDFKQSY
ncbi:hypothetical protein SAMD00019534_110760 [Acytostelium subglobosum LB1]|uniref:hypothetical protein n=1 Tax=Acytostelium subglobosum LB1 TaxID=1410327 RepID=UPI0006450085|nr:hypothetical protein SAMD00019534_110760 [Acytostelium subglobosum LB1]GAM27900.1 hypothetical protein SAMD00019534_110760 [Acytostelium subglobosum LB1]|eukprot:XP_012749183.1 hypothetical protein SAMD00019534_110760 [Acytostelium subglobosum LB1]